MQVSCIAAAAPSFHTLESEKTLKLTDMHEVHEVHMLPLLWVSVYNDVFTSLLLAGPHTKAM